MDKQDTNQKLPEGWIQVVNEDNEIFYVDMNNKFITKNFPNENEILNKKVSKLEKEVEILKKNFINIFSWKSFENPIHFGTITYKSKEVLEFYLPKEVPNNKIGVYVNIF